MTDQPRGPILWARQQQAEREAATEATGAPTSPEPPVLAIPRDAATALRDALDQALGAGPAASDCFLMDHHGAVEGLRHTRATIARVRATVANLRGERLTPDDMRAAILVALDRPAQQQPGKPTHPDGSSYGYRDIVVEGWDYCVGCNTWIRGYTTPHPCTPDQPAAQPEEPTP